MKPKAGTTVRGFSKAGFSCCASWNLCDMGLICVQEDPEAKNYCRCYIRKQSHLLSLTVITEPLRHTEEIQEDETIEEAEALQMSLF